MLHPVLFILAFADVLSGIFLFFHPGFWIMLFLYLGILSIVKGGWSLIAAISSHFYFDFLGFLDIVAGMSLLFLYYNFTFPFLTVIGIMMMGKGIWSLFFSVSAS